MKAELFCFLVLAVCAYANFASRANNNFIDPNQFISSTRLVKAIYKCMVGLGPCNPTGEHYKKLFPEIIQTKCAKCVPDHKKKYKQAMLYVMKNQPDVWAGLVKKFDPTGMLTKNLANDPAWN